MSARFGLVALLTTCVALALACGGGGVDPSVHATVAPTTSDGNTVLSSPGNLYPSPGLLAVDDARVVYAYGFRDNTVVLAVPKDGGPTTLIGYPGSNVHALALAGDTVYVGTDEGLKRSTADGFERVGPRDLNVRAITFVGDVAYLADLKGVVRLDLASGATKRLLDGATSYSWALALAEERLYYSKFGTERETGYLPLGGGQAVVLSSKHTVDKEQLAIALWEGSLVVPSSIGPSITYLPVDGGEPTVVKCGAPMSSYAFAGDAAWLGAAVGHSGAIGQTAGRRPTTLYSRPGGKGGLVRCDLAAGKASENLAPGAINLSAIATDAERVYFLDSERGLVMSRPR